MTLGEPRGRTPFWSAGGPFATLLGPSQSVACLVSPLLSWQAPFTAAISVLLVQGMWSQLGCPPQPGRLSLNPGAWFGCLGPLYPLDVTRGLPRSRSALSDEPKSSSKLLKVAVDWDARRKGRHPPEWSRGFPRCRPVGREEVFTGFWLGVLTPGCSSPLPSETGTGAWG